MKRTNLIETTAQRIRRQNSEGTAQLHTVTCSCDAEWQCKKESIAIQMESFAVA